MSPVVLLLFAADFGFSSGVRPLDVGAAAGDVRAASCAECHEAETAAWARSRHRVSVTNEIFRAGLAAETEARCVRCHAPLPEQVREVAKTIRSGAELAAAAVAREGVSCAVCHVRDGEAHGNAALSSDALCGACHQFAFHEKRAGELVLVDELIQTTYGEWQRYAARGGKGTCRSCHMPDGSHDVRGAHDAELLGRSLVVGAEVGAVVVESRGVGHDLPSGDVFPARHDRGVRRRRVARDRAPRPPLRLTPKRGPLLLDGACRAHLARAR